MRASSRPSIAVTAAIVLVVSAGAILWQLRPRRLQDHLARSNWFYDLNSGQLFAAPLREIPPIQAPSGPRPDGSLAGVRARIFGCGNCAEKDRRIAYLETYSLEEKLRLQELGNRPVLEHPELAEPRQTVQPMDSTLLAGQAGLVKRVDDADWVPRNSPEGQAIISQSLSGCPGSPPIECHP